MELQSILESLWQEFIVPSVLFQQEVLASELCQGEVHREEPSTEEQLFWKHVQLQAPDLAREACRFLSERQATVTRLNRLHVHLRDLCRLFFLAEHELDIVNPLAQQLGLLPRDAEAVLFMDKSTLVATSPSINIGYPCLALRVYMF